MSVVNLEAWQQVFGYPPEGVFVIVDPQVGESRGQLRALPLLVEMGLQRFTFASGWRTFDLVPFDYLPIHENISARELTSSFPICQFVSQTIELSSPSDVARKLLMAQKTNGTGLLVYVIDSEQFMLRGSLATKSFIDEYVLKRTFSYQRLFTRYYGYLGHSLTTLSADLTLNLAFHRLAWELQEETLLRRLGDLFDFGRLPPSSWGWDLLERLAGVTEIREDEGVIPRLLHAWVDRDITRIGRRLFDKLQEFNFELTKIQAERQRLRELQRG